MEAPVSLSDLKRRLGAMLTAIEPPPQLGVSYRVWIEGELVEERRAAGAVRQYPWPDLGTKNPVSRHVEVTYGAT